MAIYAKSSDIPEGPPPTHPLWGMGLSFKQVYGQRFSIAIGTRQPGYRSRPHSHSSEQVNYCLEGEVWLFVEDKGYKLGPGDFLRVPANAVHWLWNRSGNPNTLFEVHSPLPQVDGNMPHGAGLFDATEHVQLDHGSKTTFFPDEYARKVEAKYT